jgi:hypothetical protein
MTVAVIRTSDRIAFRRCRRRWGWSSPLRTNLEPAEPAEPLWMGSLFHYAMEDFHGYNVYGHPARACDACVYAQRRTPGLTLPENYKELVDLCKEMVTFYADEWLVQREPLQTFWFNGEPQVEVEFELEIPYTGKFSDLYEKIIYRGKIDRVVVDEFGILWPKDFKTAAQYETLHLDTDPQVTAYCWAIQCLYQNPVGGFIYQQHHKTPPHQVELLASGKLSANKAQRTTHARYWRAMKNIYGSPEKAPANIIACANELAQLEDENGDRFVRRDVARRNQHQIEAEGVKIMLELEEMLNPDLPLYPSPTRDCGWCPWQQACISMDDGSDWQGELERLSRPGLNRAEPWRRYLPDPQAF